MIIHSINDLRKIIRKEYEHVNVNPHCGDVEELISIATDKIFDLLVRDYDFKYGDELPDHDIDYLDLIDEYSVSRGY